VAQCGCGPEGRARESSGCRGETGAGVVPLGFEAGDDSRYEFALQALGVVVCERSGPVRGFAGLVAVATNPLEGLDYVDQINELKLFDWPHGELTVGWIVTRGSPVRGRQFIEDEDNIDGVLMADGPVRGSANDSFHVKVGA
jgi:hypothetical protein